MLYGRTDRMTLIVDNICFDFECLSCVCMCLKSGIRGISFVKFKQLLIRILSTLPSYDKNLWTSSVW